MSDRIIFNGKVYGETVNAPIAIVVKEEEHVDPSGNYVYIIEDEKYTETIGFKNGSRVKYGDANTMTVVCQGLKMNKALNPTNESSTYASYHLNDNIQNGMVLPSDLYSSFNVKMAFPVQPKGIAPLMEKYEIIAPMADVNSIYECLQAYPIFNDDIEFPWHFEKDDFAVQNNQITISDCHFTKLKEVKAYKIVASVKYEVTIQSYTLQGRVLRINFENASDAESVDLISIIGIAGVVTNKDCLYGATANSNKIATHDFGTEVVTINPFGARAKDPTSWSIYEDKRLMAYANPATISETGTTIPKNINTTYSGVYFLVNSINYGQTYGYNKDTKDWSKTFDYGYAYAYPIHIHITELKNKMASIYLGDSYTHNYIERDITIQSQYINIVRKQNGNSYDYYYKKIGENWKKKDNTIFLSCVGDSRNINILGTTDQNPLDGNCEQTIHIVAENDVDLQNYLSEFFNYEISNNYIEFSTTQSPLDWILKNNDSIIKIPYPTYSFLVDSNTTEKDNNGNPLVFVVYIYTYDMCLTAEGFRNEEPCPVPFPFESEAERNFSLGIREDLRYITEEEYNEFHGGETNE